ncbi:MAG: S8 family serine peptidase [Candidatus Latescibacteria bacterium]|nr:S8 family serine peptidase [Candidatus Latescibacterota bacterium]
MKVFQFFIIISLVTLPVYTEPSISPVLFFLKNAETQHFAKTAGLSDNQYIPVTVRFNQAPDQSLISDYENHGLKFKRFNGKLLHTQNIYPASIDLNNIEYFQNSDNLTRIEYLFKPVITSTLDVSNPQVQARNVWDFKIHDSTVDGTGVIIANIDTGIDIYHPGFFKPDGGTYNWLDTNNNGIFDPGTDSVDLNNNGMKDNNETLNFYDAYFRDPLDLMPRTKGIYDTDIDWLFNDENNNGSREYGPDYGFTETDPAFGELVFITNDTNKNGLLDPNETLTALGTSRIIAIIDEKGIHHRGQNLFTNTGDITNHGTGSSGIVGGQTPGRRLTGMAPGVEFICINQLEVEVEENVLIARELGADICMYEFVSWIFQFLDGSSNLETFISDLHTDNFPQFTASGNLAGPARKKHALVPLQPRSKEIVDFYIPDISINNIYLSIIWPSKYFLPVITLNLDATNSLTITGDETYYNFGDIEVISGKEISPKGMVRMDVVISSEKSFFGDMSIVIENKNRTNAQNIDLYIRDDVTDWMNGVQFQNFVTDDGTVCSPATAENDITVGAYDPRGTRNEKGAINDFSSWGKTTDGRRAVDITAPGTLVYSLSTGSKGIQTGGYLDFGGTSAALPHIVGCSALIMQVIPDITSQELENILYTYAYTDNFTGTVPNDIWGYGKIRIYDSMKFSNLISRIKEQKLPNSFFVSESYPNPFNNSVQFDISIPNQTETIFINIFNIIGQNVYNTSITPKKANNISFIWNGKTNNNSNMPSGIYFFQFISEGQNNITSISRKSLFLK